MFTIRQSDDYETLTYFFAENGLEIEAGAPRSPLVINCWECRGEDGELLGAASLEKRDGAFVVADLAVAPACRGAHLAVELMAVVEAEILRLGGDTAWLVGKAPGFYQKLGWEAVPRAAAPNISKCFTCPKFGGECRPEIMRKTFSR